MRRPFESIGVKELGDLLGGVDPGVVRVNNQFSIRGSSLT
jgi:hypothetical protein